MSNTRDENQRRIDGDLPDDTDPEADAVEVGADGKPSILAGHWRTLEEAGVNIADEPPRRKWLLMNGNEGALPLGKAGVLAAGGGTGKTMALVQLALAVATGGFWLDVFKVATPGNVLIALAEEDIEEVHRRFYRAGNIAGKAGGPLNRDERAEAAKRIVALPLAGNPVALTCKDKEGNTTESPFLAELRERLADRDWSLIILDPLARWAGDDAEVDNAAATRFVQAVESLVRSRGNPTVLVAHHSSASSIREGAANVRGATGIVDGFRWAAVLDSAEGTDEAGKPVHGVRLRLRKSNYTKRFDDVFLVRTEEGGALRKASAAERTHLEQGTQRAEDEARKINAEARKQNAETRAKEAERKAKAEADKGNDTAKQVKHEDKLY